jgi:hypothetical protein
VSLPVVTRPAAAAEIEKAHRWYEKRERVRSRVSGSRRQGRQDGEGELKAIPKFKTEVDERRFWEEHDSTQYVDWSGAELVRFPNLKPSTQSISLRLPASLLDNIKLKRTDGTFHTNL